MSYMVPFTDETDKDEILECEICGDPFLASFGFPSFFDDNNCACSKKCQKEMDEDQVIEFEDEFGELSENLDDAINQLLKIKAQNEQ